MIMKWNKKKVKGDEPTVRAAEAKQDSRMIAILTRQLVAEDRGSLPSFMP